MDLLVSAAEWFIGLFQNGAEFFGALVAGILPLVIVLLTAVNALIKFIGQDRIESFAEFCGRPGAVYAPLRYLVLPVLAVFFLTNPACYAFGAFLPEKNKPAFYDSAVSFVHPITGLFPHANAAELFVWLGIAQGVQQLDLPITGLAVRYLLVGLVVIFIRGLVTQVIFNLIVGRTGSDDAATTEPATA